MCKIPVWNIVLSDPCINKLDFTSVIYIVRLQLKALIKHGHAMQARVIFLDGWFEMGH